MQSREQSFRQSRWFTRAWTLQELLASRNIRFYDKDWLLLGTLWDPECAQLVLNITRVDVNLLLHKVELHQFSIAQGMSWAAHRQATRLEDRAYSLFGIFDVNVPPLYGVGMKAFIRLQEEIIKRPSDLFILCWEPAENESPGDATKVNHRSLLAGFPDAFVQSYDIVPVLQSSPRPYQMTNRGLEIALPLRSYVLAPD